MSRQGTKRTVAAVLVLALALATAACGRKGGLETPGAPPPAAMSPATVIGATPRQPESAPAPKPDRPIFLDVLI
ncbi:LPS translocon maturation chaperone LptM [Oharaeibacter diazotrophicus]|uniref:Putative lipoprotein n=1 Tax=Oharaeibacter diazotrophicus TaxID=1920512 RepID=A0A4V3CVW5_9HYPH|nr:lipoprotein [Oharaeibacter diazotrophicus]TDP84058.1 putative lipoprotein [Oharaeibacter diazotrophicus]BBE73097.1 hypothetical protein OHA_1_02703 [Pleomorphomonas sp. SM30]GLS74886.1 hypothetical protein GCM10007904_02210 [Oharaeibacter diazotrophicus]